MTQSGGRARAPCGNQVTRTVQTERHRALTTQRSDGRRRNRIDAGLFRLVMKPMGILALREFKTAAAAAENNSDSLPLFHSEKFGIQLCIMQSLARSDNRKRRGARDVLAFFRVEIFEGIDASHLAGNLNGKRRRIERRDPPNTAACVSISIPQFRARIPKGSNTADAANDDAPGSHPAASSK